MFLRVEDFQSLWFLLVSVLSLIAGFILQKRYNERFRRFPPGPTGVPLLGYLPFLGKEPHKTLAKLSKKYGTMFGLYFGPSYTIIINDSHLTKEVLNHPNMLARPKDFFDFIPGKGGFAGNNGEVWREQRRFCLHSMKNLGYGRGLWEEITQEDVAEFSSELMTYKGKPFDVSRCLTFYGTCNNISLLIGRRLPKRYTNPEMRLIYDAHHALVDHFSVSSGNAVAPWLAKYLVKFHIAGYHRSALTLKNFSDLIRKEVNTHMNSEDCCHSTDFIGLYLSEIKKQEASGQKHHFSVENLIGHLVVIFFAGSGTVITSLYWLFLRMASNLDVQEKVQEELDDIIGKDGRASWSDRFKLPYTMSTILEAERWVAINPLYPPRCAAEDTEFNGYIIPKGCSVICNSWAMMHDERHWEKPDEFLPERFLQISNRKSSNIEGYCPFSFGKRGCPGENMAMMTITLFFISVMQKFSLTTPSGDPADLRSHFGITISASNQELCFKER